MEILTAEQIFAIEAHAVDRLGIQTGSLMERAGYCVYEECAARVSPGSKVLLLCGRGNNGGDGMVCARYLVNAGYEVRVLILSGEKPMSKQLVSQRQTLRKTGIKIHEMSVKRPLPDMNGYDVIIDALLGTGFSRPADGLLAEIIEAANRAKGLKIAVDIPTGLDASSTGIPGPAFMADLTVTFTRPKIPHYLYPAGALCGETAVRDVGIPDSLIKSDIFFLHEGNMPPLPARDRYGHKGDYGHAVIVGGSLGKTGAAIMAGLSALRAGAGYVTCTLPGSLYNMLSAFPELMAHFCKSSGSYMKSDAADIKGFLTDKMVVALGPGIGRSNEVQAFVQELAKTTEHPFVIDADALYALDFETLSALSGRAVLTPHIGEFAHLAGVDKQTALLQRLEYTREYAKKYKICLVLKSAETVITLPDGTQYVYNGGSPALSKAGSGDILTGILTALICQGYSLPAACVLACKMQGDAAKLAAYGRNEFSVSPRDIIDCIGMDNEV